MLGSARHWILLAATITACSDGGRGESARPRQLVRGRNVQPGIVTASFPDHLVYQVANDPGGRDVWVMRKTDGARELVASNASIYAWTSGTLDPEKGILLAGDDGDGDAATTTIALYIVGRGVIATVDRVSTAHPLWRLPNDDLVVARMDAEGHARLWVGRFEGLVPVVPAFEIGVLISAGDRVIGIGRTDGAADDVWGLFALDLAAGDVSELLPAASGSDGTITPGGILGTIGCWPPAISCPGLDQVLCGVSYLRRNGGIDKPFLFRLDTNQEIPLPFAEAWFTPQVSPDGRWGISTSSGRFSTFDNCAMRLYQCPEPVGAAALYWHSTGTEVLLHDQSRVAVAVVGREECPRVVLNDVASLTVAAGDRLVFSRKDPALGIWTSDFEGRGASVFAAGTVREFWTGPIQRGRAYLLRPAGDMLSLSSVDLDLEPPREQPLANDVAVDEGYPYAQGWSRFVWRFPRTLATIVRMNSQDRIGDLAAIDLDSGSARVVDHAVAAISPFSADLVYQIRTRFPTDRDGVWWAPL